MTLVLLSEDGGIHGPRVKVEELVDSTHALRIYELDDDEHIFGLATTTYRFHGRIGEAS